MGWVESKGKVQVCKFCSVALRFSERGNLVGVEVIGNYSKEVKTVATSMSHRDESSQLKKLKELEAQYKFAMLGLMKGGFVAVATIMAALITFGGVLNAFVDKGSSFMSGKQLVILYGVLVLGLIIYLSLVFFRAVKLRLKISKTKKSIHVSSSENVHK